MRIQHNISALNAHRQLSANNVAVNKNLEKLSSGYRINRAGDDAAGLAISEKMRGQIRGLNQATSNANDGISLIQTAEGALNETHSILQRMRELAVQSANGTYQDDVDRENLDKEVSALKSEVDRVANSTHFNKIYMLNGNAGGYKATSTGTNNDLSSISVKGGALEVGDALDFSFTEATGAISVTTAVGGVSFSSVSGAQKGDSFTLKATVDTAVATADIAEKYSGLEINVKVGTGTLADGTPKLTITDKSNGLTFQIGSNGSADQKVTLNIDKMDSEGLGIDDIDILSQDNASDAIATIDDAINTVSATRADLGALQNRLEHTVNNLGTTSENLTSAESRIRDVDMAKEMMEMTKNNILSQAAQAMLAQANAQPQNVLQLLQ